MSEHKTSPSKLQFLKGKALSELHYSDIEYIEAKGIIKRLRSNSARCAFRLRERSDLPCRLNSNNSDKNTKKI